MGDSDPEPTLASATSVRTWLWGGPAVVLLLGLAGLLGWHSLTDLDIWFHLRAGRDLLAGGGFTHIKTNTFADPSHPWLNHEWLFQALAAWTGPDTPLQTEAARGWNLLRLGLILALVVVLVLGDGHWRHLWRGSAPLKASLTPLAVLGGLFLLWPRFNLRPELVSYVFIVLLVRGADAHYRRPAPVHVWRDRSLWKLGGWILIWAQCHGFAVLGPLLLLMRLLVRPLDREPGPPQRPLPPWPATALGAPILVGLAALVLTPNHWRGLLFPLRAIGQFAEGPADLSRTVSELAPLLDTPNALGLTLGVFKLSLVWGVVFGILAWGRVGVLRLVLFAAAALAALTNQRSIALYGLAFILLHTGVQAPWPGPWWRRRLRWDKLPKLPRSALIWTSFLVLGGGCIWWAQAIIGNDFYLSEGVGRRFGGGSTPATYPRQAASALSAATSARTFANLDAAAFLLGTTEARLWIDGRTEAYPAARWAEYLELRAAGPEAESLLEQYDVTAAVLALSSGAFHALAADLVASPTWRAVAADDGGVLFVPGAGGAHPVGNEVLTTAARRLMQTTVADPTRRADLYLAAAGLHELAGNAPAARHALVSGLDARPDHPLLNHNLGNVLLAEQDFAGALDHFRRALDRNGRLAGSALNMGVCQMRLGRLQPAVASFRRSVALDPQRLGGWVNLAVALQASGENEAAISALEKAQALQPDNARLQGLLREWRQSR